MSAFIIWLWAVSLILNIAAIYSDNSIYNVYVMGYAAIAGWCAGEKLARLFNI